MQEWLTSFIVIHPYLVYALIAILSSTQGPILSVLSGILLKLGYLDFIPAYAALMLGDLLGDTFWYWMGRLFGHGFIHRFGKYVSLTEEGVESVQRIFHRYTNRILLVSKLTMGLGFALVTLFTAGLSRIPFKKYIALNAVGQFFWTAFLLAVGYLFGQVYESVNGILAKASLLMVFVLAFVAILGFGKYVRGRMASANQLP